MTKLSRVAASRLHNRVWRRALPSLALPLLVSSAGLAGPDSPNEDAGRTVRGSPAGAERAADAITAPVIVAGAGERAADGTVTVGPDGATFALPGGASVRAAPGSKLRISPRTRKVVIWPNRNTVAYSVVLRAGRIDADVPSEHRPIVSVTLSRAPELGAVVLHGSASVIVDGAAVTFANRSGETLTSYGAAWRPLAARHARLVTRELPNGQVRPIVEAPSAIHGNALRLSVSGAAEKLDLGWPAVPNAAAYDVTLLRHAGSASAGAHPELLARTRTRATSLEQPMAVLPPGAYELSVRAVDASGLESTTAATQTIHVVGVSLPPGASIDGSGSVYLPTGKRLAFEHREGLSVGFGEAPSAFLPMPPSLGLHSERPMTVMLRSAAGGGAERLVLYPVVIRAEVRLSPKNPVWPRDTITAEIVLHGPSALIDSLDPTITAKVGVSPIRAAWQRRGNVLKTTFEPAAQHGAGPWVLRIEAEDTTGARLAHGFVEIAPQRIE